MKEPREAPCEAVMLLIKRMESHPTEFNLQSGKWYELLHEIKERAVDKNKNRLIILSDMECDMLWGKFVKAGQQTLLQYVTKKILGGADNE